MSFGCIGVTMHSIYTLHVVYTIALETFHILLFACPKYDFTSHAKSKTLPLLLQLAHGCGKSLAKNGLDGLMVSHKLDRLSCKYHQQRSGVQVCGSRSGSGCVDVAGNL